MLPPQRRSRRFRQSLSANRRGRGVRPRIDPLEGRRLLATFTVSNLNDAGPGSLRQAILDSNVAPGPSPGLINFTKAGTIALTSGALPAVVHPVTIDGTTAPGFAQTPVVEVAADGFGGLRFDAGSAGSTLKSIGIVDAGGDGVTLNDHTM